MAFMRALEKLWKRSSIEDAMQTLRKMGVEVRGPIATPHGHRIVLIGKQILLEAEIINLHQNDELNPEAIRKYLALVGRDAMDVSITLDL